MTKIHSGSPVPRQFVFIASDGAFVVQLSETRVQDLLTGRFRVLEDDGFGHPITDYELNQLKAAGRVEHYNRTHVWIYNLPEPGQYIVEAKAPEKPRAAARVRAYYLNTTRSKNQLERIRALLAAIGLSSDITVEVRSDLVAILGKNGLPFLHFQDAEALQKQLMARAPESFKESVIAFIEVSQHEAAGSTELVHTIEPTDLDTIIASQTDTSLTQGRRVVLLFAHQDEQHQMHDLCVTMKMEVELATTGANALQLLEDLHPDLLVMDLQLPDMHGWEMLMKIKEIVDLRDISVIVLAEPASSPNEQSLALTVAKVDVYLVKPVSKSLLRQNIWMALKQRARI